MTRRLNVSLDPERAAKLARHCWRGLAEADPDAQGIVAVLDAIPGAHERARLGLEQARRGETVALDEI